MPMRRRNDELNGPPTTRAQLIASKNSGLFNRATTVSAPAIAFNGGNLISVRVTATADALFPVFVAHVSADITATD
jgi:hypothetical protein